MSSRRDLLLTFKTMRRTLTCLALLALTIPLGLAARYAPLHLTWFWQKYLGSALWAVALYWFIAMLLPHLQPRVLFLISTVIALIVELSRLIPNAAIDAFRLTLAGKLLLGRYFSVKNIAAYFIAIVVTAIFDNRFHPGRRASNLQAN